jgi:phosphatidylinositol glycan class H protein
VYTIKEGNSSPDILEPLESLLVIKDLGLELKTTYLLFNKQESKFIDQSKILEIIINEGISRWQVKFYLAVIVDGGSVAVVFENLLPRLDVLKEVYNGTRKMMYNK